ncbi:MAG TPA: glycosyltransferase [Ignavibacteria bacterium]|nr:glycosyltransferase [Ignavibacteria bacterium]
MKVLIINQFTRGIGGVDKIVNSQVQSFEKNKIDYKLFSFLNKEFDDMNAFQKAIFLKNYFAKKLFVNQLEEICDSFKPDIVHFHNLYPFMHSSVLNFFKTKNIKKVYHLHNFYPFCLNSYFYDNQKICFDCYDKKSFNPGVDKKCYNESYSQSLFVSKNRASVFDWIENKFNIDKYIAVSNFVKTKYVELGFSKNILEVIYNPVESTEEKIDQSVGDYVLFMGSIIKAKGIFDYVSIAKNLKNIKFIIAGDGKDLPEVLKLIQNESNIEYVGEVDGESKKRLLTNAKLIIAPSLCYETFGLIVIEANCFGKPVLASRRGGLEELVTENKNGFLYEPLEINSLMERVQNLYEKLPDNYDKQYCYKFSRKFSPDIFYNNLMNMYNQILNN